MATMKLFAVGDIFLQTSTEQPFEHVREVFKNKDILFGNLETVLATQGHRTEKAVSLRTSPENVKFLKQANFDILNIANNHILDLGPEGFHETLRVLTENNLTFIGGSDKPERNYAIVEQNRIKVGFLGYCNTGPDPTEKVWINKIKKAEIIRDIEFIKLKCNFVVISLHWGIENVFYPSPEQIELAHNLIDAGATVILGHHPHIIQGIEQYRHGLIAYSLGNFQFDPSLSYSPNRQSFILIIEVSKDGLVNHEVVPVQINENFVPMIAEGEDRQKILNLVKKISQKLTNGEITENWWFEQIGNTYLSGNMKSWIIRIRKYGLKHLLQCMRWLVSPFVIKCYLGVIKHKLATHD